MYDAKDPRVALAGPAKSAPPPTEFGAASYDRFYDRAPDRTTAYSRSWLARAQNFIVEVSEVEPGAVLERANQIDEYVLLAPERGARTEISVAGTTKAVDANTISFVPPGSSSIRAASSGCLVRIFSARSADLAAQCANAAQFATPTPNVAPIVDWPAPVGGYRLRTYSLDVPSAPGRFGRIWRGSVLMVNMLYPDKARNPKALSPHHHDDFEQGSLALDGEFVHHLRWPWITDMTQWRADEHERCASPSLAVIPPPAIHTSQSMAPAMNQLVDIFCPPRRDFSAKPGWVLNEADYPALP